MSGYRDTGRYLPPHRREGPVTPLEWVAVISALGFAALLLFSSIAGDHAAARLGLTAAGMKAIRGLAPAWVMISVFASFARGPDVEPATAARRRKWLKAYIALVVVVTIVVLAHVFIGGRP